MLNTVDFAWLAGIVEGEGCFYTAPNKTISLTIGMTDKDVMERIAWMLEVNLLGPYFRGGKPGYFVRVSSSHAAGWMMTLYPFLGRRRREKIKDCLTVWKAIPSKPNLVLAKHRSRLNGLSSFGSLR